MTKPRDEYAVELGRKIAEVRKKLKWTQATAAKASDINGKSQFANYERGVAAPTVRILQKIAFGLGVSVDSLLPEYKK